MDPILPLSPSWGLRACWKCPLGKTEELPTAVLAAQPSISAGMGLEGTVRYFYLDSNSAECVRIRH